MKRIIIRRILHFIYPTKCPICGTIIGYNDEFCDECYSNIKLYEDEDFQVEGSDGFCCTFIYDKAIANAVILLKDGICGNAAFALGNALARKLISCGMADMDGIIPVPLHKTIQRQRGYNQAELIANQIADQLDLPVYSNSVFKAKLTKPQKELSRNERLENLKDAFTVIRPEYIKGKKLLLLDDVCTTGSTLTEITRILKNNGASKVYCASCCKTMLNITGGSYNEN